MLLGAHHQGKSDVVGRSFLVEHKPKIVDFKDGNGEREILINDITIDDSVKEDMELWYPKVKIGGYLCGHDYDNDWVKRAVDEILQYVTETNIYELQGIICFCSDNKQLKIMNNEYQELFFARGNEPSIKFRYLQVRMNQRMHTMLCKLYPNMLTVLALLMSIDESFGSIFARVDKALGRTFNQDPSEEMESEDQPSDITNSEEESSYTDPIEVGPATFMP